MIVYLRNYWECITQDTSSIEESNAKYKKAKKYISDYGKKLEEQGWTYNIMDAGYCSEDRNVIFYINRTGHVGQLYPYLLEGKVQDNEFAEIAKSYVNMDDFIILE